MLRKILFCTSFFAFYFLTLEYAESSVSRAEKLQNHYLFYGNYSDGALWSPPSRSSYYASAGNLRRNRIADPRTWIPSVSHESRGQYTQYDGWQKWVPRNLSWRIGGSGLEWGAGTGGSGTLYVSQPQVTGGGGGMYKNGGTPNNGGMGGGGGGYGGVPYGLRQPSTAGYQPFMGIRRPSTAGYQPLYPLRRGRTQWSTMGGNQGRRSCVTDYEMFGHRRCLNRSERYALQRYRAGNQYTTGFSRGAIVFVR
ncbi:MAG: hypothetical protein ACTSXQ_03015 [Alphaproteobacteria bacterium]